MGAYSGRRKISVTKLHIEHAALIYKRLGVCFTDNAAIWACVQVQAINRQKYEPGPPALNFHAGRRQRGRGQGKVGLKERRAVELDRVSDQDESLERAIQRGGEAVTKNIGDAITATYPFTWGQAA